MRRKQVIDSMRLGPHEQPGHPDTERLKLTMERNAKARLREQVMKCMRVRWDETRHGCVITRLDLTTSIIVLEPEELEEIKRKAFSEGKASGMTDAKNRLQQKFNSIISEALQPNES